MDQTREGSEALDSLTRVHEPRAGDTSVVLLFGCTGTGKTSFANMASGSEMEVGKGVRSSTKHLEASKVFQVDGQPVVIIDCPGFNDTYLTETEILRRLADYLIKAYESNYKVAGLLYFHKISDTRVGGASFRHMNMFKALCGSDAFKNVVYVTNMWSEPPTEDEVLREEELRNTSEFFGEPLVHGAQVAPHNNTPQSAFNIIRKVLGRGRVVTRLQRQLVDDKMPLEETDVGLVIGKDLEDDLQKQQKEMDELKAEKEKASAANNQEWLRRLETHEERTRIKEQQLVAQLQVLRGNQAKQLDTTSQQTRVAQGRGIASESAAWREQVEAKMEELMRSAKYLDGEPNVHPSTHEWNQQRNEENDMQVAMIRTETALSRRRAANRKANLDLACGLFVSAGKSIATGLGTALSLIPRIDSGLSPPAIDNNDRSGVGSFPTHEPTMENIAPSYGASNPHLTQQLKAPDTGRRQEHISIGSQSCQLDGGRNTSGRSSSHAASSRQQQPGDQNGGGPGQ
ncbi:50S ribosome-binding GTPase [Rhizoctonia solani 123E]|uniref:50S ribosome-binding GTPase n=1 Tax=Rhizoctonia solani 123E TaxID=1423351 RepID=A0A074RX00_9AGAM|nr:50S ribosome-binding GTPase [Rhizoctonia solani 123E]